MVRPRKDPADEIKESVEEKSLDEVQTFDVSGISIADFKAVPRKSARMVHPFEGYALKPKVKIGKASVSATHIVALNPTAEPTQDPSGLNQTVGKKRVTLRSYHSRMFPVGPSYNEEVVFDRVFETKDGNRLFVAVVPRHENRARLAYTYNWKTERIETDPRYLFLDSDQVNRLRKLFQLLINPKLKKERQSAMVAGEVETSDAELQALPEGA